MWLLKLLREWETDNCIDKCCSGKLNPLFKDKFGLLNAEVLTWSKGFLYAVEEEFMQRDILSKIVLRIAVCWLVKIHSPNVGLNFLYLSVIIFLYIII